MLGLRKRWVSRWNPTVRSTAMPRRPSSEAMSWTAPRSEESGAGRWGERREGRVVRADSRTLMLIAHVPRAGLGRARYGHLQARCRVDSSAPKYGPRSVG